MEEWGRWEGRDRDPEPVEIDIAARLSDGRVLTGEIKWSRAKVGARVHLDHLSKLQRLSSSGVEWAHRAGEGVSPLLYVAAGGFSDELRSAAEPTRQHVYLWTLEDFYDI